MSDESKPQAPRRIIVKLTDTPVYAQVEDVDVDRLTVQAMEVVRREIDYLLQQSATEKLSISSARDLATYIRLLKEISHQEDEAIAKMTDEELEKFLRRKKRVAKISDTKRIERKIEEETGDPE